MLFCALEPNFTNYTSPSVFSIIRFETQEDTGKHLRELQLKAEKSIRDLGAVKEELEAEWERVKFMGQEENTELREKLELLDEDIQDELVGKFKLTSFVLLMNCFRHERKIRMKSCKFLTNFCLESGQAWRLSSRNFMQVSGLGS